MLERLSQSIIIYAGKHPKIKLRVFDYMRALREHQIKDAKEYQNTSKRPSDNDLALHSIFFFEIFFTEAFNELEKGLDKIFRARSNPFSNKWALDYKEFINETATSLTSTGAYINLPILCNIKKSGFQPHGVSLNGLPEGIGYIQLQLYKTLPSFIILSAQVILEDPVNSELDKFINGYYEGEISLKSLSYKRFGYSSSSSENEKTKAIKSYIAKQKTKVEIFIKRYVEGLYLSAGQECPSIEIYTISKMDISDDLIHRRTNDKDFWRVLRIDWPYQDLIFSNPPFTLFIDHETKKSSSHKIIINKSQMDAKYYGSIDGAVIMESFNFISEYSRSFLLNELLNHFLNKAKYLNVSIENSINKNPKKGFRKIIKLRQEVFKSSVKTEKLLNEFEDLRVRLPSYWKRDQFELFDLRKRKKLADFLLESIEWKMKVLQNPYKMIESHADRFLKSKNIQVNYSLQRSLRILSVVLLIATVIQILVALKVNIGSLIQIFVHFCGNIISALH